MMDTKERLDYIEFRMDLLRENTELSNYLYDCKITKEQYKSLLNLMSELRSDIDSGKEVNSAEYEAKVLTIVGRENLDYHFCEEFAQLLWEEHRYEEVFPALYRGNKKFSRLFSDGE